MKFCRMAFAILLLCSCSSSTNDKKQTPVNNNNVDVPKEKTVADIATILAKKEVPILCYHDIRNGAPASLRSYTVTPAAFAAQMKILSDSGYKTILPNDLYEYLVHGAQLPEKPVMITFDDTDKDHYTVGAL